MVWCGMVWYDVASVVCVEIIVCFAKSFKHFQELPEQWNNCKKNAVTVKQQVAPLQAAEVAIIRRKCGQFDVRISNTKCFTIIITSYLTHTFPLYSYVFML